MPALFSAFVSKMFTSLWLTAALYTTGRDYPSFAREFAIFISSSLHYFVPVYLRMKAFATLPDRHRTRENRNGNTMLIRTQIKALPKPIT